MVLRVQGAEFDLHLDFQFGQPPVDLAADFGEPFVDRLHHGVGGFVVERRARRRQRAYGARVPREFNAALLDFGKPGVEAAEVWSHGFWGGEARRAAREGDPGAER